MEIVGYRRLVAGTRPWKVRCRVWNDGGASPSWPYSPAGGEAGFGVGVAVRPGLVLARTA
eukprot:1513145-Pleurochrysis_carterae.AAC.1